VWTEALGNIVIHNNLRKRHVVVVEWCCMCRKSRESIDYLMLHYEVAKELWSYLLTLFGVEWVMPRRVITLLYS